MVDQLLQIATQIIDNCDRLLETPILLNADQSNAIGIIKSNAVRFSQTVQEMSDFLEDRPSEIRTLSFELRTPVTAIRGFAQFSLKGLFGTLTDTQYEYLTLILDYGNKLTELMDRMMGDVTLNSQG